MTEMMVISGFLGSGKTTLLKRLIQEHGNKKLGIIVNDFGAVEIDSKTLHDVRGEVRSIGHGSLFCTCKSGEFIEKIGLFNDMGMDLILVETSGLADPGDFESLVDDYLQDAHVHIRSFITVVDATRIRKLILTCHAIQQQIRAADLLLVSKLDISDEPYNDILSLLRSHNSAARIEPLIHGRYTTTAFDALEHKEKKMPPSSKDANIRRFMIRFLGDVDYDDYVRVAKKIAPYAWRVKGLYSEGSSYFFEYVEGRPKREEIASKDAGTLLMVLSDAKSLDKEALETIMATYEGRFVMD